jgi:hypothetical protein
MIGSQDEYLSGDLAKKKGIKESRGQTSLFSQARQRMDSEEIPVLLNAPSVSLHLTLGHILINQDRTKLGSGKCYPFNQMKFHQASGFYVASSGQDKSGSVFHVYIC